MTSIVQLVLCIFATCAWAASASPKPVIIDTDIMGDVDDVGALAIANVLHNCGVADLRGVVVNTYSEYSAIAVSAVNTWFANGDIPIGAIRPINKEVYFDDRFFARGEYASKLANTWPRALNDSREAPTPLEVYRKVLGEADDNSITIISVGFLPNLADLLRSSSDKYSEAQGTDLVASKVKELVVMGGQYPTGQEFNFYFADPASTNYVVDNWPSSVPITYSGYELGGEIYSGFLLPTISPPNSPILASYQWYVGRGSTVRQSWDPITTLYGILGTDGWGKIGLKNPFVFANDFGHNQVTKNGTNFWVHDQSVTNQHWLKMADGINNSSVSATLDHFFTHNPMSTKCF